MICKNGEYQYLFLLGRSSLSFILSVCVCAFTFACLIQRSSACFCVPIFVQPLYIKLVYSSRSIELISHFPH